MNVLIDHHHGALFRSLYYLFNKRLKFNVYVPYEMDWLEKIGLYSCYNNIETSKQMLLSWIHDEYTKEAFNFIPLTYDEFSNGKVKIDYFVPTLFENLEPFERINNSQYGGSSKVIYQVGNNTPICYCDKAKNLLSSSYPSYLESSAPHKLFYRQEFSLDHFTPTKPENIKSIGCFRNVMDDNDIPLWNRLKELLPDWEFKAYGHGNEDGVVKDREDYMSKAMGKFGFIYHVKHDEGYGHVIHNAFALGKPMIVNMAASYRHVGYDNNVVIRNTSTFLFEKDTSNNYYDPNYHDNMEDFILDSGSKPEFLAEQLTKMANNYDYYSNGVIKKFNDIVDFQKDADNVKTFLDNLI